MRDENDDDAARRAEIDNALIDLSTLCLFRRALAIVYSAGAAVISELATRLSEHDLPLFFNHPER